MPHLFLQVVSTKWKQNYRAPSKQRTGRKHRKHIERQKTSFQREQTENADLYKAALNKIMATHELCINNNFGALLCWWDRLYVKIVL